MEDTLTSGHVGFDRSGKVVYRTESRGRDTAALVAVDLETEVETVLAKDDRVDVGGARPRRRRVDQGVVASTKAPQDAEGV